MQSLIGLIILITISGICGYIIDRLCCMASKKFAILKWIRKYRNDIEWTADYNSGILTGKIKQFDVMITVNIYLRYNVLKNRYYLQNIRYIADGTHINENDEFNESGSIITSYKIKKLESWAKKRFKLIIKSKELNLM